jgi:hypothetical protein
MLVNDLCHARCYKGHASVATHLMFKGYGLVDIKIDKIAALSDKPATPVH